MTALHDILLARFAALGAQPAISLPRRDISYDQLSGFVAQVQPMLEGCRAIGILSTRRPEAYVTALAAFFSGVRFVPLNPALPQERLARILTAGRIDRVFFDDSTSAQAEALNVDAVNVTEMLKQEAASVLPVSHVNHDSQIAYQMFTSGSTGDPKGVPISYANLSHYVTEISDLLRLPEGGRYSQLFDLSFDLSMHDIYVALSCGGCIVPASDIDLMMPHMYLAKRKIDIWFSVPLLANVAARGQGDKAPEHHLRMAMFCGEALPTDYAAGFMQFLRKGSALHNLYGPTEATIAFTAHRFDPEQVGFSTVPIGAGFGANQIAIETDTGTIVTPENGAKGEFLLAGPQVFDGYEPAHSADVFVTDEQIKYYRSGDLVEMREGQLIHLGRKDTQIKFHGYRIELAEIEAMFRQTFDCGATVALMLGKDNNARIVMAYEHDEQIDDFAPLAALLPKYMIPTTGQRFDHLPTNINGKVDRKALAQMTWPE